MILNLRDKALCGFEGWDEVLWNDDGSVFGNVPCGFLGSFLYDKAAKATQVDIFFFHKRILD